MAASTRVLVVARRDVGGCFEYLCQELRRRTWPQLRCVVLESDAGLGFPVDVHELYDGGAELRLLLESVDVLQLVDLDPHRHDIAGVPIATLLERDEAPKLCVHLSGMPDWCAGENELQAWVGKLSGLGVALSAGEPWLAHRLGLQCLPPFVPWWRSRWTPLRPGTRARESVTRPALVFASSSQNFEQRPRLEQLIDDAQQLPGDHWVLECVHSKAHASVLQRRRFAHLTLTEHPSGLALSGLESLCQGVPVVADMTVEVAASYAKLVAGAVPPVHAKAELPGVVAGLDPRAQPCELSVQWARSFLDPRRWFEHCELHWSRPAARRAA